MKLRDTIFEWNSDDPYMTGESSGFITNFNYLLYNTMVRGSYNFELHFKIFKIPGCQLTLRWSTYSATPKGYQSQQEVPLNEIGLDTGVWSVDSNIEFSKEIDLPWNGLTTPLQVSNGSYQFISPAPTFQNVPGVRFVLSMANAYVPTSLQPNALNVRAYCLMRPIQSKDFLMGSYSHVTSTKIPRTVPLLHET
jgi:hypothetical protein